MEPQSERIPLAATKAFSKLILDLTDDSGKLDEFISESCSVEGFKRKIESRNNLPIERELLAEALTAQYSGVSVDESVNSNIEALRNSKTFTVTTGHQLNIFTGPLYFHYKILCTIKLAEQLSEEFPEYRFVPIYWMNSEDHDIEEVGQVNLFGEKFAWNPDQAGATGRMDPSSLSAIADQLKDKLRTEDAQELLKVFADAYSNSKTLTEATRAFVNELYGDQGLVIVDSDDAALKQSFHDVVRNELTNSILSGSIESSSKALENLSYHAQVNPREINFFRLIDGERKLLLRDGSGFSAKDSDQKFTTEELLSKLDSNPEEFSYNVVSRPLFQEFILPNLAYIGGGGEIAYWLQYKQMFEAQNVSFPVLVLRDSFLIIDPKQGQIMDENSISLEDLFQDEELLINSIVEAENEDALDFSESQSLMEDFYQKLISKASDIDQGLSKSVEAEKVKHQKSFEQLQGRFRKALKQKGEVKVNRIRKMHRQLFPNGGLQERSMNILEAVERFGPDFIKKIKAHEEPLSTKKYTVIRYR